MVFKPKGSWVLSRCTQLFSIRSLSDFAKSALGSQKTKSKMNTSTSFLPWCPSVLKCFPMSSVRTLLWILSKWPCMRFMRVVLVSPTYCFLHLLHWMQYIKLELLQVTFFLQEYSIPVYVLLIVPDLFNTGQWLHFFVLQKFLLPGAAFGVLFSDWSPIPLLGNFALTSMSLRFGGRL